MNNNPCMHAKNKSASNGRRTNFIDIKDFTSFRISIPFVPFNSLQILNILCLHNKKDTKVIVIALKDHQFSEAIILVIAKIPLTCEFNLSNFMQVYDNKYTAASKKITTFPYYIQIVTQPPPHDCDIFCGSLYLFVTPFLSDQRKQYLHFAEATQRKVLSSH